jgi:hypothetical protein
MEEITKRQADIRQRAEYLIHRNEQLINILDNWMPTDEANANMEREFMERRHREREVAATHQSSKLSRWQRILKKMKKIQTNILTYF